MIGQSVTTTYIIWEECVNNMKKDYSSPEFELLEITISDQLLNPSGTDEGVVPGGPSEDPIGE